MKFLALSFAILCFVEQSIQLGKPRCPYRGEPENGLVAPTKFSYEPGDELQITCNPGFESKLEARPRCLSDGTWSAPLPNCTNYSEI